MRLPAGAGASLRLRVPPDARYGRYARERVASFAAANGIPAADAEEFVTAVSEALANAIEHSQTQDSIELTCWLVRDTQLLATVVDRGIGFAADDAVPAPELPDPLAERGRGLPIMRRYSDIFSIRSQPGKGTSVILGRSVRPRHRSDHRSYAG